MKEAIAELWGLHSILKVNMDNLDLHQAHKRILELQEEHKISLSYLMKVLLTLNGSLTRAIQSIQPDARISIEIKTLNQIILGPEESKFEDFFYQSLDIFPNDLFNFRKVLLHASNINYVLAYSLTPIKRLKTEFKDELLRADIPIGKLIEKYKLETFRKLNNIDLMDSNSEIEKIFNLYQKHPIFYRMYDIVSMDKILMKIIEFFNPVLNTH